MTLLSPDRAADLDAALDLLLAGPASRPSTALRAGLCLCWRE